MSGLFGGGATQSVTPQRYNGIQVSSSASGGCIPLLYGQQRLPFNLIWYGAFTSTPNTSSSGGKGGGSKQTSSCTYRASFACALCEGPALGVVQVWLDKDLTTLSNLGFTLFLGAGGQATWSYLTTNFPAQAIPYDHICYIGAQNYLLGNTASMPNINFEVKGILSLAGTAISFTNVVAAGATSATLTSALLTNGTWLVTFSDFETRIVTVVGTAVQWNNGLNATVTQVATAGGYLDADPSAFIPDYLSDPNHGVTFPSSQVGVMTGANSFQAYVQSMSMFLSPCETTQRASADFLKEILQICNSDAVWSAGVLKIIPYCDVPVSGNGFTFTPNLTPLFSFGDSDFLEPPIVDRVPLADTFNHVRVEYVDRSNAYKPTIAEASDLGDIAVNGERVMSTLSFHEITSSSIARVVAQLVLQTSLYERNTLTFKVRSDYCLLEPMDYVAVTDVGLGYVNQVFRIIEITESDVDELEIKAMEITGVARNTPVYNWSNVQGYNANFGATPGSVQAPAFMEASGVLVGPQGGSQLWISVNGPSSDIAWGGCVVFMSFDGTTYDEITRVTSPGRHGIITTALGVPSGATPDVSNTIDATLNDTLAVLGTGTADDALENRLLVAVGSGATLEIISYETSTLVGGGHYNLTTLYRGLYGTTGQSHLNGAQFMRLDGNILAIPLDPGWMGLTLHFKFCSFNQVGRAQEDISSVTDYTYTPNQNLTPYNSVSESTFSVNGSRCAIYSPTSAFKMNDGGSGAFDAAVYSTQSYTNGCTAECSPSGVAGDAVMGLTLNPLASPNFTNIAYGWGMSGGGGTPPLNIFESGSSIGVFGTYAAGDNLQIVYDGKHVAYYHNGALLRSVPIANQTFFMQISMSTPGVSVFGMSFSNIATAVTPFTLVPMSLNVAAAGTRVVSNTGAVNTWGIRNFKSAESYNNGVQLSFSYTPSIANNAYVGFSTAPLTGGGAVGANSVASFYMDNFTGQVNCYLGGSAVFTITGASVPSDVFTLTYDNYIFRWWKNGALQHQEYQSNAGALFLFGDFLNNGEQFSNISFTPYGLVTPNPFVASADGFSSTHDSTAYKISGGTAWNSSVYSLNVYTSCHLQFKTSDTTQSLVGGFTLNPLAGVSFTNIAYGWLCDAGHGTWDIYEGGSLFTIGAMAVTDLVAITYDSLNVRYYLNGVLKRTTAVSSQFFYAQFAMGSTGAGVNNVSFGPGVTLDSIPTASIDPNAASQVLSSFVAGASGHGFTGPGRTLAGTAAGGGITETIAYNTIGGGPSVTIISTGQPLGIDLTVGNVYFSGTNFTSFEVNTTIWRDGAAIATCSEQIVGTTEGASVGSTALSVALSCIDTPSAGSHTYTVAQQLSGVTTAAGVFALQTTMYNLALKVREYKK